MKKILFQMPIQQRYEYIRNVYKMLSGDINKCMEILQISKNTIYTANSILNPQPRIYDHKLQEEHKIYIHARTIENPYITGLQLSNELLEHFQLKVSDRTINMYRNEAGLQYRPPIRSVLITPTAAQKRFDFTKYHLENQTDFSNIVFTDESWFFLGSNSKWVWIDKNQITDKVLQKKQAHSPKLMVWGGIAKDFKTNLVIVQGNVNSETYIDQIIFGSDLIESADDHFGIGNWKLMQDNARPHVSFETKAVLKELDIDLLDNWPPYSPDLNIIEVIWAIMGKRVEMLQPKTIEDLQRIVIEVWDKITFKTINGLVDGITDRLKKVNQSPGQSIHFYSKIQT